MSGRNKETLSLAVLLTAFLYYLFFLADAHWYIYVIPPVYLVIGYFFQRGIIIRSDFESLVAGIHFFCWPVVVLSFLISHFWGWKSKKKAILLSVFFAGLILFAYAIIVILCIKLFLEGVLIVIITLLISYPLLGGIFLFKINKEIDRMEGALPCAPEFFSLWTALIPFVWPFLIPYWYLWNKKETKRKLKEGDWQ